jgi:hypothetical protein
MVSCAFADGGLGVDPSGGAVGFAGLTDPPLRFFMAQRASVKGAFRAKASCRPPARA